MRILMFVIWLIDIMNISFVINGIDIATFLDVTLPLNTLFWLLYFIFVPKRK